MMSDEERLRAAAAAGIIVMEQRVWRHAAARLGRASECGDSITFTAEDRDAALAEGVMSDAEMEASLERLPPSDEWPKWLLEEATRRVAEFKATYKSDDDDFPF